MKDFPYELTIHVREQIVERKIPLEWIRRVLENPSRTEPHKTDPELRHALGIIPENGDRVLRVVYNSTTQPWRIVTVHFDRRLKGKL